MDRPYDAKIVRVGDWWKLSWSWYVRRKGPIERIQFQYASSMVHLLYLCMHATESCFVMCRQVYFDDTFKILAGSISELKLGAGEDNSYGFTLYQEWTRKSVIGAATYKCTNTKTMYEAFCNGQLTFGASVDAVQVQGIVNANSESSQVLAVIGGTGKYLGARGQAIGVKQTAQGGIKNRATFTVWTVDSDPEEATATTAMNTTAAASYSSATTAKESSSDSTGSNA
jgi:hypothetical protein